MLAGQGRSAARLVVIDERLRVRTAALHRIETSGGCGWAGISVDRRGERASVLAGGAPLAEVDLRTMRVAYHPLGRWRSLPAGRWTVFTLPHRLLAAARLKGARSPGGVVVIDTRTWRRRLIDGRAGGVRFAGDRLLVFDGGVATARPRRGLGVREYGLDGRPRGRTLPGQRVWDLQIAGRRAYAFGPAGMSTIVIASGRVVATSKASLDRIELLKRRDG
ncbi:MAG TPA: hypothetical protein VE570_05305 [Thermoleophilaceae bacterium]|nr:hypothetical protein [Thermoleophilaceae bacterium]